MITFIPDRRRFIKYSASITGACLVLGINWGCDRQDHSATGDSEHTFSPNAWLRISPDDSITIMVAESEMGQGPYTLMPMLVAEELEVDWSDVRVEHAPLDPAYGFQRTGGSSSIRKGWLPLREAGAIAREMLISAGASELAVPVGECRAGLGQVEHTPSGRHIRYGALVGKAAQLPIPELVHLKQPDEFRIIGTEVPRLDTADKVNGKARFGIDTKLPGMLYATIAHCPVFGGSVGSFEPTATLGLPGVRDVFQIDEGVVVVADDTWTAFRGKQALQVEWNLETAINTSSASWIEYLKEQPRSDSTTVLDKGDVDKALEAGSSSAVSEYTLPFQAHVPLEPMNCTAHYKDGLLEIWAPTQSPSEAQETARIAALSKFDRLVDKIEQKFTGKGSNRVKIHTTLLGGGFGRRLKQDYVSEAVRIAMRYDVPVQLVWSREEDVQHDFYHPLVIHQMQGALDPQGRPAAWLHTIRGGNVSSDGATQLPYDIPNVRVQLVNVSTSIPYGPWRSVSRHYNTYAVEHFFDELANAGGHDPVELRLRMMQNSSRLRNTLEIAADRAGWARRTRGTKHFGVAAASSFGSHVTQIAEISETGRQKFRIDRITCVIDCGIAINPDIVEQQMEGSIIFALTAATRSEITLADGRVEQSNYHDYPILGIQDTPEIDVVIARNDQEPGGIGEPGVPPLAPALANAMLSATGRPVSRLPVRLG